MRNNGAEEKGVEVRGEYQNGVNVVLLRHQLLLATGALLSGLGGLALGLFLALAGLLLLLAHGDRSQARDGDGDRSRPGSTPPRLVSWSAGSASEV